ncbi:DNA-deoxyinosine glycosylase [Aurantiacibacter aquimixticola]|uniref:DNA-deoxyinosine glycosylase n=1 Tax=Aurantiacibacter aquimixticola TaxID=1958945 RepID=A0A419RT82_9SPHN|nr:DNA-deoxyinosine glycosylase [Aurantiacibacter aquimixticola]RJY08954.1 DNA-deoxyinosine glycosylase [Aurantiacibacter aquimixticola]
MSPRKSSFPPVVDARTRVLILGSLPGEESLAAGQYYAHPRNRFWHLVGNALRTDLSSLDYDVRLEALRQHGIGLWDVIASARRDGSLDTAIRDAKHNPLAELVADLPNLRAVAFNGAKSAKIGMLQLQGVRIATVALPSSSPAYAAMTLAEKEKHWLALRDLLESPPREVH